MNEYMQLNCRRIKYISGYFINDYKFHTKVCTYSKIIDNSGVHVKENYNNKSNYYFYDIIIAIIKIEYFVLASCLVLFKYLI